MYALGSTLALAAAFAAWVEGDAWIVCLGLALFPYTGAAVGACGWTFAASLIGYRVKGITLEDEYGERITYRGPGARIWCVAGMALAVLMFGLCMTLPVGALLDWLDLV